MKPNLLVVARFLDRLAEPGSEWKKSRLQLAVRLNYDVFTRYMTYLEERGFVEVQEDPSATTTVRLTLKGNAARERLQAILREWVDGSFL